MPKYSSEKASKFWSKRLKSTDPLAAVLTYNAPACLNEAYDLWEREMLKSALDINLKGKKTLDIGCGIGRITLMLAKLDADVTAVDVSKGMLEYLEKTSRKEKLGNQICTVRASSADLPFEDQLFDIVTCFGLLEHLPEEVRQKTILEAIRVMRPKGKMFFVVNNADCVLLKKNYPMKTQQEDGYFVTLVGLKWLESACKANRMKVKVIASNPMYALNHYFVSPNRKSYFGYGQNFASFCRNSTRYDISATLANPGIYDLTSHLMVCISAGR